MTNLPPSQASRRAFLQRAASLSIAGAATPMVLNLAAMANASAANATDYKALVCIFLYGGNDYANTLVPYDTASYNAYQQLRPSLAYARDKLDATVLKPQASPIDRNGMPHEYALAPELADLSAYFQAGQMASILNVGTLVEPTTKQQYQNKSVALPPKLFSHNDQQSFWQSSNVEGATSGWGGRMGDLLQSGNSKSTFTCINVSGNAVYLSGKSAVQYQVSTSGPTSLAAIQKPLFGSASCSAALQKIITQSSPHWFENEYVRVMQRALDANGTLSSALAGGTPLKTVFPTSGLGNQLKMVAQIIASAAKLGTRRQVFFVSMGGFDNHDGLLTVHPGLLSTLSAAMSAFYQSTLEMGVAQNVTSFTASDFGRTLSGNNDGSDHGWGSMHFVLGGAVRGQRFYGKPPVVAADGPDDVGQGRLLPTTSVDQYAATLGRWLGVSDSDLLAVLPNLSRFNVTDRNLGFI